MEDRVKGKSICGRVVVLGVVLVCLFFAIACQAGTIYVDADANGANNGSTWEGAFNYLQDALAAAADGDEIWVAEGVYTPDSNLAYPNGTGDRGAAFHLVDGVAIKGGYAGYGEPDPNAREIGVYETILSGDLNGDDGPDFNNIEENSYHVVVGSDVSPSTILEVCTIERSYYTAWGGGLFNENGSPTINNCIFRDNRGRYGGGAYNKNSSSWYINCTFVSNFADWVGGGMYNPNCGNMKLISCKFIGNWSRNGGGIRFAGGKPTLINCMFIGNSASIDGGGILNWNSSPNFINCSLSNNESGSNGGGIGNVTDGLGRSDPGLSNCILWGNTDSGPTDKSAQIYGGSPVVNYCCIQGWTSGGTGNIGEDPLFVDSDGADNIPGTEDDNLHLLPLSPCVDAGDNNSIPNDIVDLDNDGNLSEPIPFDIEGNSRFADNPYINDTGNGTAPIVDMGVYESFTHLLLDTVLVTVAEGDTNSFTVALAKDPCGTLAVNVERCFGDSDISVETGGTLTFDSSNYWLSQTVTLAAAEDDDHLNDKAGICISTGEFGTVGLTATESDNEPYQDILFVDANAQGKNNGSNWSDALTDLYDAISIAESYSQFEEIRMARGIYTPAEPSGDRGATFRLISGVAIKGGYAGYGEPDPNYRDIDTYKTILSGDLNGNDGPDFTNYGDNSYHVVIGSGTDANTILSGFTITGGSGAGGGIYNRDGDLKVLNCIFTANKGGDGGGMYNKSSSPTVINCIFRKNYGTKGGGLCNVDGRPTITNCAFIENESHGWQNGGGGVYNYHSTPTVSNCIFIRNSSYFEGGGIHNDRGSNAIITNCLFSGNTTSEYGGGLANSGSHPILTFCTFVGNRASGYWGGGINGFSGSTQILTNCILWNNRSGSSSVREQQISSVKQVVNYCCIEGLTGSFGGIGNFGFDPCFVEAGYWDTNGVWVDGDHHLLAGSPCTDAGDPNYVAEPNETDIDSEPRVMGGRVDMGADEVAVLSIDLSMDELWMYQNLTGGSGSSLTATASTTYDPNNNSSYSYAWEIVLPGDVTLAPVTVDGGGAGDGYWTFAARGCDEPGGLSDSGQTFTVRVTVTGDDYGNTGQAEAEFGIALLGDTNNDGVVNVADRSIANAFWRTGSAGPYTLRDCDVNCDGVVNVADRSIANAIWRGILGQNSVSSPCPLR